LAGKGRLSPHPNPDDRRSLLVELDSTRAQGAVKRFKKLEQIFLQASSSFTEDELRKVAEFIEDVGEIASRATDLDWADARDRFGSNQEIPCFFRNVRCP
jgi:hypothetical protein